MANKQTKANKRAVRHVAQAMLNRMTLKERSERSRIVCRELLPWFEGVGTVALFAPRPDEPDLRFLGELTSHPGHVFLFPRIDGPDLAFARADRWSELHPGRFGLSMPAGAAWPQPPGLVVVPGLAFDMKGRRIGRGAGYYDRYLARLPTGTLTIGVGFGPQLVEELPYEPHDIHLQMIITDEVIVGVGSRYRGIGVSE